MNREITIEGLKSINAFDILKTHVRCYTHYPTLGGGNTEPLLLPVKSFFLFHPSGWLSGKNPESILTISSIVQKSQLQLMFVLTVRSYYMHASYRNGYSLRCTKACISLLFRRRWRPGAKDTLRVVTFIRQSRSSFRDFRKKVILKAQIMDICCIYGH